MGFKNSCYVGQAASELTYSQSTMIKFLEFKEWKLNSGNWPFSNINEFLIVYVDDISVFSPRNIPNAIQIHCNVLEFTFFAS